MVIPSRCSKVIQSHEGAINTLRLDSIKHLSLFFEFCSVESGEYFMTGGSDRLVRLWNPLAPHGQSIQAYAGHSWDIVDLVISPDNSTFTSVGGDRTCFYWDVSTGRIIRRYQGHTQRLTAVAMNETGTVIASGSVDRQVRLWDCRSNERLPIQMLSDARDSIGSIDILGSDVLVGSLDGSARIYDIRNAQMVEDPVGEAVTCIQAAPDNLCYLVACLDSTVRLIDRTDGSTLNTFTGHLNKQYSGSCTFSKDGGYVLAGSEDGLIHIWDFLSGEGIQRLTGHSGVVSSLAYHPKTDMLLSASFDGTIRVWT